MGTHTKHLIYSGSIFQLGRQRFWLIQATMGIIWLSTKTVICGHIGDSIMALHLHWTHLLKRQCSNTNRIPENSHGFKDVGVPGRFENDWVYVDFALPWR